VVFFDEVAQITIEAWAGRRDPAVSALPEDRSAARWPLRSP